MLGIVPHGLQIHDIHVWEVCSLRCVRYARVHSAGLKKLHAREAREVRRLGEYFDWGSPYRIIENSRLLCKSSLEQGV